MGGCASAPMGGCASSVLSARIVTMTPIDISSSAVDLNMNTWKKVCGIVINKIAHALEKDKQDKKDKKEKKDDKNGKQDDKNGKRKRD